MNIQQLRRNCDMAGFVHLLGFMEKLCWQKPRDFAPIKRDTKKLSPSRIAMEKGAKYLVQAEIGIGLDVRQVEISLSHIKTWKYWFVQNMKDKDNQQLEDACQKRIWIGVRAGKKLVCEHKDHKLGEKGAAELADNLFRMFYDNELRALQESPMDPYFTRDPGAVEFGESMSDAKYLPRQFAEQPTGPEYHRSDDENAADWNMGSGYSDDEVVEDVEILPVRVDWEDRNERYFELRQDILHRKFSMQKILRKALFLARTDMIGWNHLVKLRSFAADVVKYGR